MKKITLIIITLISCSYTFAFDHTHEAFSSVLKKNTEETKGQVLVNYKQLKKHPEGLLAYLEQLQEVTKEEFKKFSWKQKMTFWINAYNAFTIELIVKNYPLKSIKKIGSIFSSAWSKDFISLMGKKMSLDDIEHNILRKKFKDPRVHFALNCASISCPSLLQEAYNDQHLNAQLDFSAKRFLNNRSKNYYDKKDKIYFLSKIFKWYGADFNAKYRGYLAFIHKYIKAPAETPVEWLEYDWSLNELK